MKWVLLKLAVVQGGESIAPAHPSRPACSLSYSNANPARAGEQFVHPAFRSQHQVAVACMLCMVSFSTSVPPNRHWPAHQRTNSVHVGRQDVGEKNRIICLPFICCDMLVRRWEDAGSFTATSMTSNSSAAYAGHAKGPICGPAGDISCKMPSPSGRSC